MAKKVFGIMLSVMLIFVLGMGFTDQIKVEAAKQIKMGFAVMDLANPYHATVAKGFKARCEKLGVMPTVTDGKMDATTQVSAIENYIASKMDLIICSPVDPKAIEPLVKKAHAKGIKFLSEAQMVEGSDGFITLSEYEYGLMGGKMAGEWMKKNCKGAIEVAILDLPELKPIIDRAKGLADGVKQLYPKARIVASQSASTPETGMKATETILQAHPKVKVIVAINDAGALGAYEVVKAMGKAKDDFYIGGLDATAEAIAKMKEGGVYRGTVDIDPLGTGALCVDVGLKILKEGPLKEKIYIPMFPVTQEDAKKR